MKYEREIDLILSEKTQGKLVNVLEVLDYTSDRFEEAFAIALEMDNRNLAKLLYSNYNAGKIIIEFTLLGMRPHM